MNSQKMGRKTRCLTIGRSTTERLAMRSDLTQWLSHLTRARFDPGGVMTASALDVLLTILEQGRIIGSDNTGFVCGDRRAVCFQDTPIFNLAEVFYQEKQVKDRDHPPGNPSEHDGTTNRFYRYTLYGLSFLKSQIWNAGGRPVFYEDSNKLKGWLPQDEWWRIVDLDWNNPRAALVDWTHEREWRVPEKLEFEVSSSVILLPGPLAYRAFVNDPRQQAGNFLKRVAGVVTVSPLLF